MFLSKPRMAFLSALTAAALAVLFAFTLAVPAARAQSGTSTVTNLHYHACLSEDGTSLLVGLSPCNTNHSEYWTVSNPISITVNGSQRTAFELRNLHSNLCLDEYGYFVEADTCYGYHTQYWFIRQEMLSVGTFVVELENYHYGLCLGADGSVVGTNTCDPSNSADYWFGPAVT
jgi:hypothetical protein